MLATYRSAEASVHLSERLAALALRDPAWVTLGGLDVAATDDLARATCTHAIDAATARIIAERTGGNPFFIKETARLLDSEGVLAAASEVPAGVREVLQRWIARLPATAETVLRQASVLGTETDVGILGEVAGVEDNVLLDAVDAGLLTGLVTEPAAGRIRFAHALIRDTLYDGLSRLRRSLAARPRRGGDRAAQPRRRECASPPLRRGGHRSGQGGPLTAASPRHRPSSVSPTTRPLPTVGSRRSPPLTGPTITSVRDRLELVLRLGRRAGAHRADCPRAQLPAGRRPRRAAARRSGSARPADHRVRRAQGVVCDRVRSR